jgi:hypothetical protein
VKRVVAALFVALSACAPRQAAQCDVSATRNVSFTQANARDVVTARAIGPNCAEAISLYAVREADGHLIWTWASPLRQMYGDGATRDSADAFVQQWALATVATTSIAPAWQRLAPGQTTLDRLTYEDIRARNLPMLCHLSGTAREVCAFWEPAAGVAGLYLERNVETTR